ncbi:amino acid ABC transporter permease [Bosea sp. 117]|uniref:amino acid ABC transporter permease n=1 Tax=Bosea sp. 117 TaxID=1125973 RepID=UPI0004943E54|nr:amino acid ABC transporter permease [Bosea sp. 117]
MQNLDYFFIIQAWPLFLKGLWVTLYLTFWANVAGLIGGALLALCTTGPYRLLSAPAKLYIEFFRCTPALVQIVWFFFCVPILFDVFWSPIFMGVVILGMNLSAFNAEAFRAAIQTIPRAHVDAAVALGLTPFERTAYVIMPQALRYAIPVLITNGIGLFQQTSLVALVGVDELMYNGRLISTSTYRPIETYTFLVLFYLAVSIPIGRLAAFIEARSDRALKA